MSDLVLQADAFRLPFRDASFDVAVADPPYEGKERGKRDVRGEDVGYVFFSSRDWWPEVWRVVKPSGWIYLVCSVAELPDWYALVPDRPRDLIPWHILNATSRAAMWKRKVGGVRAPVWRPILAWQREPRTSNLRLDRSHAQREIGSMYFRAGIDGNHISAAAILSNMHEAVQWPNQLPFKVVEWLLRPHAGRVLDVFSGTGTTREAALSLGLGVVSVDLSPEAAALTARRQAQLPLPCSRNLGPRLRYASSRRIVRLLARRVRQLERGP